MMWSCLESDREFLCIEANCWGERCWGKMLKSQVTFLLVCIRSQRTASLHAWLALAQRPKELTLFKAEHILGTSGDTRILSPQLRGPVKDQGNSRSSANWAVSTTKAEPAGRRDKASEQQGAPMVRSGHLCLTPYTARGIVFSACVSASSTVLGSQSTFIWRNWEDLWTLYCKGPGKEDLCLFCLWGLHSFFPLSLEVLPEQRINFTIKTLDSCVKEGGEVFFPKRKLRCFCPRQFRIKRRTHWFLK